MDSKSEVDSLRQQHLAGAKSVVVKLGSQLLSSPDKRLNEGYLASIARQVGQLRSAGIKVTLVSSGAVAAGLGELQLPSRPSDLARLQAVAATGQPRLMAAWAKAFEPLGLTVGQILLTYEDIENRTRFLNLRNTLLALHDMGVVPIINENDTVSTAEIVRITFGDNDILASLVSTALRADVLVLLSVVDGLLDAEGKSVRTIRSIEQAQALVKKEKSSLGKGGMDSKLQAAARVTASGECLVIADGRTEEVLPRILKAEEVGSFFPPARSRLSSKVRWIGAKRPAGSITVDDGAAKALGTGKKSLLPAGIISVKGNFNQGDLVSIINLRGKTIAVGLSNYESADVQKIAGLKTAQVRNLLGQAAYEEVIHRDNLLDMARPDDL